MIRRAPREEGFTVLQNETLEDADLSWESLGLLTFLLSKPDDWTVSVKHLINARDAGRHKIRRILSELEEAGYMVRTRKQDEDGKFQWESLIYDTKQGDSESIPEKSVDGSSTDGSSTDGEPPDITKTDSNKDGENKQREKKQQQTRTREDWSFIPDDKDYLFSEVKEAWTEYQNDRADIPMLAKRYVQRNGKLPMSTVANHSQEYPDREVIAAYVIAGSEADRKPLKYANTILEEGWSRSNGSGSDSIPDAVDPGAVDIRPEDDTTAEERGIDHLLPDYDDYG